MHDYPPVEAHDHLQDASDSQEPPVTSSRQKARTWTYSRQGGYEQSLQRVAAQWFRDKGFAVEQKHPYILQHRKDWRQNIILKEVADYIDLEHAKREHTGKGLPIHRDIHNGRSSQAMLFNLLGPLILRNDLEPLKTALEAASLAWPGSNAGAYFEYQDRKVFNEDSGQPTSIDLVLREEGTRPKIFIEAKLVEKEFGGCSVFAAGDCDGQNPAGDLRLCYLDHIGRTYWHHLKKLGFLDGPIKDGPVCVLSVYYQFFREVLFALANGGKFVLLTDERSPVFHREGDRGPRGFFPFLCSLVPQELQPAIKRVTIQSVVAAIESSGRHDDWVADFRRKYGLQLSCSD